MSDGVIGKSEGFNQPQAKTSQPDVFTENEIETLAELLSGKEKGEDTSSSDSLDDTGEYLRPKID